jgi:hypothetical protein
VIVVGAHHDALGGQRRIRARRVGHDVRGLEPVRGLERLLEGAVRAGTGQAQAPKPLLDGRPRRLVARCARGATRELVRREERDAGLQGGRVERISVDAAARVGAASSVAVAGSIARAIGPATATATVTVAVTAIAVTVIGAAGTG